MSRILRLAKESGWVFLGQVATLVASLMLVKVLTESLNPTQYGELALGLTIATLINQVAIGAVSGGISRFFIQAIEKKDVCGYIKCSIRITSFVILGIILLALFFAVGGFFYGQLRWLSFGFGILILSILSGINNIIGGMQNAVRNRRNVALHTALEAWLRLGLVILVAWWIGATSSVVIFCYAISVLFVTCSQLLFLIKLISQYDGLFDGNSKEDWCRLIWKFSWPMMLGGIFNWGYYASQRWALELFVSTADVGKFYALTQVAYSPISLAGSVLMSIVVPIFYSKVSDLNNYQQIKNVRRIIIVLSIIGIVATIIVASLAAIFNEKIFQLFVAKEYHDISKYMPHIVIAAGLLQSSLALGSFFATANITKKVLPLAVYGQAIIALSNFISTYFYGIDGLIFSMLFAAGLHISWMYLIVTKERFE